MLVEKKTTPLLKVRIGNNSYGRAVFAKKDIKKNEVVLRFRVGSGYYLEYSKKESLMNPNVRDYAIPFHKYWYIDELEEDRLFTLVNHSCNSNCGIRNLFEMVAMRDISLGEEITLDYACFGDGDWEVPGGKCFCGEDNCRGNIPAYEKLSNEDKLRIKPYLSDWIILHCEVKKRFPKFYKDFFPDKYV